ncbi:hypothetical protein O3P69_013997 [Scylla paramamosain]|uniref:Uncharacterized protein n=1 Tax=Scylla paramamosain TaxID=85552 RepID=A0AAW0SQR1_SCYPA
MGGAVVALRLLAAPCYTSSARREAYPHTCTLFKPQCSAVQLLQGLRCVSQTEGDSDLERDKRGREGINARGPVNAGQGRGKELGRMAQREGKDGEGRKDGNKEGGEEYRDSKEGRKEGLLAAPCYTSSARREAYPHTCTLFKPQCSAVQLLQGLRCVRKPLASPPLIPTSPSSPPQQTSRPNPYPAPLLLLPAPISYRSTPTPPHLHTPPVRKCHAGAQLVQPAGTSPSPLPSH